MDENILKELQPMFEQVVDQVMEKRLAETISPIVAAETKAIVEQLRIERSVFGQDRTGMTDDQKKEFAGFAKSVVFGGVNKANEALITEQDSRGGYLVPVEVANAIQRIAASVGLVMGQAQKWTMGTDQKDIPAYTGSFLEGEYLGVDAAGSVTGLTFDQASLIAKKWQLAFVMGNDLLSDASVELADWLLALGGEALANRTDKEGFAGTGLPFVGVLNHPDVTVVTLATGKDTFAEFDLDDASEMISNVEESVLDGAAFYMNRTVWHKIRTKKDSQNNYLVGWQGTPAISTEQYGGKKPAGYLWGFPVFTTRHLPANSATAVSTKFIIFGNLKALAYGDRGEMAIAKHTSGSFGGKEIALADQAGMVLKHRHALVVTLGAAFAVAKTAAS